MPYIKQADREKYEEAIKLIALRGVVTPGELNYLITRILQIHTGAHMQYAAINSAVGALECAKLELYRRAAAPYEDRKIAENGDAYETE